MTDITVADLPTVEYGHVTSIPVHFDDLDAMGIVHNSRYAVMAERAVTIWWAERGVSFMNGAPTMPDAFNAVREFRITYQAPIRGTGEVALHFWLEHLGTTSAVYAFRFLSPDGSTVFAEGRRVNIRVDRETMRPVPWTDTARAIAADLLSPAARRTDQP